MSGQDLYNVLREAVQTIFKLPENFTLTDQIFLNNEPIKDRIAFIKLTKGKSKYPLLKTNDSLAELISEGTEIIYYYKNTVDEFVLNLEDPQ